MKNWKILSILGVAVILVLVIVGFLLFRQSSTSQPTQTISNPFADTAAPSEDLATFTSNCFESYIRAYIANEQISAPGQFDSYAQSCFTETFITQWPTIIANSESDPVLISQDYGNSWPDNVSTTIASQNASDATAIVNIGTGSEAMQVIAQLQLESDGWRISSVSRPQ